MAKKETAVAVQNSAAIEALKAAYPVEAGYSRVWLPRLGMVSQDKFEGKGKAARVTAEAGDFFMEVQAQEEIENDDGKMVKPWIRTELGKEIEGIILFQRRQLRMYDEATELYTSSPIYDTDEDEVVLFCDKKEVNRGTAKDLKSQYMYTDKAGKQKSALEDNRVLYILYNGEVYQMTLRGSSMYSFMGYGRKVLPPSVLTKMSSEAKEKGEIEWNQMTFEVVRPLNPKELHVVVEKVNEIKEGIAAEKGYYASKNVSNKKADDDFDALGAK